MSSFFFFFSNGRVDNYINSSEVPTAHHEISVWCMAGDLSNCVSHERSFAVQFTHYTFILIVYETKPTTFHLKIFKPHTNDNNIF